MQDSAVINQRQDDDIGQNTSDILKLQDNVASVKSDVEALLIHDGINPNNIEK